MDKTEELFKIVTAYRFIAMLMMLLAAVLGHYGIIDLEMSKYFQNFFIGFIGVNSLGKITDKLAGAIKESGSSINGEI